MRLLFPLFLAILVSTASQASITIQCENPKYAGSKLTFYSYSDPISSATKIVFSLEFDKTSKFMKAIYFETT